ncbi:helix-turn-helix domain-containing protein [Tianweitania populi]|uniref:HTH cro/C1-type domain-containing protein n=1 Tax=Tianweitania populi TaxID=1607949 RepID=A0A8J3DSI7_9HYPH|nr:helix-turn-helix transcriptional regulator [Tianweitania populi]GHD20963.1 hypothetical protein GCM10016234_34100 [Tianweitania populi]
MRPSLEIRVTDLSVQEVHDPDTTKPINKEPFRGCIPLGAALDDKVSVSIRDACKKRNLPSSEVAPLLGLGVDVYHSFETDASTLTVVSFIRICEVLRATPEELLGPAAPQLWGETVKQSDLLRANIDIMRYLDTETLTLVHSFISRLGVQPQLKER